MINIVREVACAFTGAECVPRHACGIGSPFSPLCGFQGWNLPRLAQQVSFPGALRSLFSRTTS